MSHRKISAALSTHLKIMPAVPDVAWENSPFDPVQGDMYLSEFYLPAETTPVGIEDSSSDQFTGVYQVTVNATSDNYKLDAQTMADSLIEWFSRGTTLTYESEKVRIESSTIANALSQGDRYMIHVSINWRSFQ